MTEPKQRSRRGTRWAAVVASAGVALTLGIASGCREEGPAERAGRNMDETLEELDRDSEEQLERMDRELEDAVDETREAAEELEKSIDDPGQ